MHLFYNMIHFYMIVNLQVILISLKYINYKYIQQSINMNNILVIFNLLAINTIFWYYQVKMCSSKFVHLV